MVIVATNRLIQERIRAVKTSGNYISSLVKNGLAVMVILLLACSSNQKPETPTLTVGFTNDMDGNIRSCGCEERDYGGIGRRATLIQAVRDTAQNFLLLETGDFLSASINYSQEKAEVTVQSMAIMDYHGVVLGEKDFGFGLDYILKRVREEGLPVVMSNFYDATADTLIFPPSRTVELSGGLKVGLIGVIDPKLKIPLQVPKGAVRITDPVTAIRAQLKAIGEQVDLVAVLAHMSRREAILLARKVNRIDLLVVGHQGRSARRDQRIGNAFILQAPQNGQYMGFAFSVLDERKKIARLDSRVEPLHERLQDHAAVANIFAAYDLSIEAKEKSTVLDKQRERGAGRKKMFLGAESCRECHQEIFDQWQTTNHAHGYDILVAQSREFDRDCTPCHTTGFGQPGGFVSLTATPDLIHIQCESCHGFGADHAKTPETGMPADPAVACLGCHTASQSPNFIFEEKWSLIRH